MKQVTKRSLLRQMKDYFPDRWEVSNLNPRSDGSKVEGSVKIHCLEDNKVFLSDFAAMLNDDGNITELTLDGVAVGKFVGKLHQIR